MFIFVQIKILNMEKEKATRHIQMSNEIKFKPPGNLHDALVYAYLRSYMNGQTKECYPSLETLCKDTELNRRTVMNSLSSLQEQDLITIRKNGRNNVYKFTDPLMDSFEPFSYEFLKSIKITPKLKGYWLLLQRYTFKDDGTGYAKTTYTDFELSEILKIPIRTIRLYNRELKNSGVLTMTSTKVKNEQGEQRFLKLFNLKEISQDMFFVKNKLNEHDQELIELRKLLEEQNRKLANLESKLNDNNVIVD